jgi:methylated-DNA-[protein]-cysteine S-methyltransferase
MYMAPRHTIVDTELGRITLVADGDRLIGLYFPQHWYMPAPGALGRRVDADADPLFRETHAQVNEFLAGTRTEFDLPTATRGDAFQEQVWALLKQIPYGQTTTYGELAAQLGEVDPPPGDRSLAQSVGQAVGHNPLSVIVPCHRVVGKDGKLTGYAGGLARKRFLLDLEEPPAVRAGRLFSEPISSFGSTERLRGDRKQAAL